MVKEHLMDTNNPITEDINNPIMVDTNNPIMEDTPINNKLL